MFQLLPCSLLSPHDSILAGQEHVLDSADCDARHREHVHVAVVGSNLLQLVHSGVKSSRRCPNIAIMTADNRLLDFLEAIW